VSSSPVAESSGTARRLVGAAVVYGLGGVVSRLASLLALPLLTSYLAPADYGVIAMLGLMTNLLGAAVMLGTGNSMGICYHEAKEPAERAAVVWSTSAVVVASAGAWALLGFLFSGPISRLLFDVAAYSTAVALAFGQMAVTSAVSPLLARWRMEEKARPFVLATAGLAVTTVAANVVAVAVLRLGLLGMLWSTFLVQSIYCAVLYVIFWAHDAPRPATGWMRRVVRLGWPSMFGVGAFFMLDFGGRLILEHYAGLESLGVYSVALMLGLGIAILTEGAFAAAWPGFFLTFFDRTAVASQVFGKVFHYYLVVFLGLAAAFFLFARPVVAFLSAPPYHAAAKVVGLIALCSVLKGAYLIFLPGLYFERKLHVQTTLEWSGALVGIALAFALVPRFGIVGAAVATVSGYLFLVVATALVARRYLPTDVDVPRVAMLVVSFVAVAWLSAIDLLLPAGVDLALRVALWLGYLLFVWRVFVGRSIADVRRELQAT
jgi:O-antigen/teichoic acid export membrane protein